MDQSEIERLLSQAEQKTAPQKEEKSEDAGVPAEALAQEAVESLLGEKRGGDESGTAEAVAAPPEKSTQPKAAATPSSDDDKLLAQDDIEKLLNQSGAGAPKPSQPQPPAAPREVAQPQLAGEGAVPQGDIEYLLNQAEQALESISAATEADLPQGVAAFRLEDFSGTPASAENATLDLIRDVELDLKIELGRTHMYLEDVLKLRKGSVVPLDKLAGDPVDIYVNGRLIARGEVLVLNDNFCVRVAELIAGTNVFA
ncbi:MAG: flagellar motor switch protein FliN [Pirellulales bacterium]|nr:flagellar motor switch protein FliN [Pirellulales bacterium]